MGRSAGDGTYDCVTDPHDVPRITGRHDMGSIGSSTIESRRINDHLAQAQEAYRKDAGSLTGLTILRPTSSPDP